MLHRSVPGRRQSRDEQGVALAGVPDRHARHDSSGASGTAASRRRRSEAATTSPKFTAGTNPLGNALPARRFGSCRPTSCIVIRSDLVRKLDMPIVVLNEAAGRPGKADPASTTSRSSSASWRATSPITASMCRANTSSGRCVRARLPGHLRTGRPLALRPRHRDSGSAPEPAERRQAVARLPGARTWTGLRRKCWHEPIRRSRRRHAGATGMISPGRTWRACLPATSTSAPPSR